MGLSCCNSSGPLTVGTIKESARIAEGSDRAPWGSRAQRGTGGSVEHPDGHDRSRAVWHFADRDQLTATVIGIDDRHAPPEERVPRVMDLSGITDTGRMKRALFNGARSCSARGANRANAPSNVC